MPYQKQRAIDVWKKIIAWVFGLGAAIGAVIFGIKFAASVRNDNRGIIDRSKGNIDRERTEIEAERNRIESERNQIDREREENERLGDIVEELGRRTKKKNT